MHSFGPLRVSQPRAVRAWRFILLTRVCCSLVSVIGPTGSGMAGLSRLRACRRLPPVPPLLFTTAAARRVPIEALSRRHSSALAWRCLRGGSDGRACATARSRGWAHRLHALPPPEARAGTSLPRAPSTQRLTPAHPEQHSALCAMRTRMFRPVLAPSNRQRDPSSTRARCDGPRRCRPPSLRALLAQVVAEVAAEFKEMRETRLLDEHYNREDVEARRPRREPSRRLGRWLRNESCVAHLVGRVLLFQAAF